ncbi:MAG: hypothetical protein LBT90_00755 [Holosporaceae bacterium]|jgi:hypothetical protein|nr:hypothetical protein [Holosporaceae bacterium]
MGIVFPILVALYFLLVAFISVDLSIAYFYVFIFVRTMSKSIWQGKIATIFFTSVFMDIYMLAETGISFLRFFLFHMLVNRFRATLMHASAIFCAYCFLLLLCVAELVCHGVAFICNGAFFDLKRYINQIMLTLILWMICNFMEYAAGKLRERHSA